MSCSLCQRQVVTKFYYEDDKIWIVNCKSCQIPMIVWKEHKEKVNEEGYSYMMVKIKELFGEVGYVVDDRMKAVKDHYHIHLREDFR